MSGDSLPFDCHFSFDISEQRADHLESKFIAFNKMQASPLWQNPPQTSALLHIFALDEHGALIGGITGRTHEIPEWLEIATLWIDEDRQGQGLGREPMKLAEAEARQRGCVYARLATSQFQAPDFYRKLGYSQYGRLDNCPRGETVYYFFKPLS
jgi:GNAT superfamily N-acetyltransferase